MGWIVDLLIAFGHWLKAMTPLPEFSLWIQTQPLSMLIDRNFWVIPTIQTIHILAIAMTFGSVAMINLRIFERAGRDRTLPQTLDRYRQWVWWGLLTLLLTGIGLAIGEPTRELLNPVFWTKMILVAVAALVALGFQQSVQHNGDRWLVTHEGRIGVRVAAGAVIGLWCVIMVLGRWIAYAPS